MMSLWGVILRLDGAKTPFTRRYQYSTDGRYERCNAHRVYYQPKIQMVNSTIEIPDTGRI